VALAQLGKQRRRPLGADLLGQLKPSRIAVSMSAGEPTSSASAKAASLAIWANRRGRIASAAGSILASSAESRVGAAMPSSGSGGRCRPPS
jgi:hypothetical protein